MKQSVRVCDLNPAKAQRFSEILQMIREGFMPASMVNPILIRNHNDTSPTVAQIVAENGRINLDSLALLYASDGLEARKLFLNITAKEAREASVSPQAIKIEVEDEVNIYGHSV